MGARSNASIECDADTAYTPYVSPAYPYVTPRMAPCTPTDHLEDCEDGALEGVETIQAILDGRVVVDLAHGAECTCTDNDIDMAGAGRALQTKGAFESNTK